MEHEVYAVKQNPSAARHSSPIKATEYQGLHCCNSPVPPFLFTLSLCIGVSYISIIYGRNVGFWAWDNLFYCMLLCSPVSSSHICLCWLCVYNSCIFGDTNLKQRRSIPYFSHKSLFRWCTTPEIQIIRPQYQGFIHNKTNQYYFPSDIPPST